MDNNKINLLIPEGTAAQIELPGQPVQIKTSNTILKLS
jgi:hypothetical protein